MKIKELVTDLDNKAYLNIVSEKRVKGSMKAKLFL